DDRCRGRIRDRDPRPARHPLLEPADTTARAPRWIDQGAPHRPPVLTQRVGRGTIWRVSATGDPMVALHLWTDGGSVTFSRDDEGREFLDLVAGQDEHLAKEIDDAWWATTPRPFRLREESRETILTALQSPSRPLSPSAIRLQKLLLGSRHA